MSFELEYSLVSIQIASVSVSRIQEAQLVTRLYRRNACTILYFHVKINSTYKGHGCTMLMDNVDRFDRTVHINNVNPGICMVLWRLRRNTSTCVYGVCHQRVLFFVEQYSRYLCYKCLWRYFSKHATLEIDT